MTSPHSDRGRTWLRSWRIECADDRAVVETWTAPWQMALLLLVVAVAGAVTWLAWNTWTDSGLALPEGIVAFVTVSLFLTGVLAVAGHVLPERVVLTPRGVERVHGVFGGGRHSVWFAGDTAIYLDAAWTGAVSAPLVLDDGGRRVRFGVWVPVGVARRAFRPLAAALGVEEALTANRGDGVVRAVSLEQGSTVSAYVTLPGRATLRGDVDALVPGPGAVGLSLLAGVFAGAIVLAPVWLALPVLTVAMAVVYSQVAARGLPRMLRRRRLAQMARRRPSEPWTWPHCWTGRVIGLAAWQRLGITGSFAVMAIVVLAAALLSPQSPTVMQSPTMSHMFAAAAGFALLVAVVRLWNICFQGTTEVQLHEMPYRLGGDTPIQIDFAVHEGGPSFDSIEFLLRRWVDDEPARRRGVERLQRRDLVALTTHVGRYDLPADEPAPGPGERVTARFTVPGRRLGTRLVRRDTVAWVLTVRGATSCGWYEADFPIPIFDSM